MVRCALAGVGLAAIQPLIDSVGVGWSFTLLATLCAMSAPLLVLQWRKSMGWRTGKEIGASNAVTMEKEGNSNADKSELEAPEKSIN